MRKTPQLVESDGDMDTPVGVMSIHVLLIDDDTKLHGAMKEYFGFLGWNVTVRRDGGDIESVLHAVMPDVVLLDVMLRDESGLDVLQRLRAVSRVPVIILTGRISDADKIAGLKLGADDYLAKPFNPRELVARTRAILRRKPCPPSPSSAVERTQKCVVGSFHLDINRQQISYANTSIDLGATEFRIVWTFMQNPGEVLSRDAVQTLAFGENYHSTDRSIDVYVSRARNKLRKICGADPIETVWGRGYRWKEDA